MPVLKEYEINTANHGRFVDSGASVNEAWRSYCTAAQKSVVS